LAVALLNEQTVPNLSITVAHRQTGARCSMTVNHFRFRRFNERGGSPVTAFEKAEAAKQMICSKR
jgi:hypothetical protein